MDGTFPEIDEAVALGVQARMQRASGHVILRTTSNPHVRLVSAAGDVTEEGKHYYGLRGERVPSAYAYEQALIDGKWVVGYDQKKHMVRRMVSGQWVVTPKGVDYFRHNQDEWRILYPFRKANKLDRKKTEYYVQPSNPEDYMPMNDVLGGPSWMVGKLKAMPQPQPQHRSARAGDGQGSRGLGHSHGEGVDQEAAPAGCVRRGGGEA